MLSAVGYPVATNPTPILRRIALERRWPILELREQTPTFPSFLRPAKAL
jgi:phosphoserine phosphatase